MSDLFARACARADLGAVQASYREQNELVVIRDFVPPALLGPLVDEARRVARGRRRTWVPRWRKAGAVGQLDIVRQAPALRDLYHSPSVLALFERISGEPLERKPERDFHGAALYVYERAGDHVGWHYDACGCEGTSSYTATIGLVQDTDARVHFQLHKDDPRRQVRDLFLRLDPGALVFFCGAKAYHRVTPLQAGEERIVYSLGYVRAGMQLRGFRRLQQNVKDALGYFGPRTLWP